MNCKSCGSSHVMKNGKDRTKKFQKYVCMDCKRNFNVPLSGEVSTSPMTLKVGISINEFRQRHDLNFIVGKVLQNLEPDKIYEKSDIVKLCNLRPGYPGLNDVLESNSDFQKYRGRIAGKYYWGTPDVIKSFVNEGILN